MQLLSPHQMSHLTLIYSLNKLNDPLQSECLTLAFTMKGNFLIRVRLWLQYIVLPSLQLEGSLPHLSLKKEQNTFL